MNNLCLIAIDLDQTLLRLDKSYDTERFNQVYRDLSKKGVLFAIISGHNRQDTNNYIDAMETEKMYIASHNGNHVVYQNELTHKELIPSLQVRRILKHLNILDRQSILLDDGDLVYSYHVEADHQKEIVSHYPKIKDGGVALILSEKDLLKITVYTDKDRQELLAATNKLEGFLPTIDIVPRYKRWIEFHYKSGGKGEVLNFIQKKHGISPSQTLTFGNKSNDFSMNKYAKYPIAMGNATEEYKASTPYIIGTNENQAVIEILEELNQAKSLDVLQKYKV